jgi:uncharacterized protein YaaW (UPF0174 family)
VLPLIEDDPLVALLQEAAESELDGLVKTLVQKGGWTCKLKELKAYQDYNPHHRAYARDIAAEIQLYGANSIASLFRSGRGVTYEEIVRDVASHLKLSPEGRVEDVEDAIQRKVLETIWKEATPEQRRAFLEELTVGDVSLKATSSATMPSILMEATHLSGFAAYKLSVIVANAAAKAVLGHGLSFVANATLTKSLSVLIGPLGWSIAAGWAAHCIAGEAYRVTVPCVLQVTMIRRAIIERERLARKRVKRRIRKLTLCVVAPLLILLILSLLAYHSR